MQSSPEKNEALAAATDRASMNQPSDSNLQENSVVNSTLIPVFSGTLADSVVQLCDARTLHTFMQVRRDFSNWIKGRISKFGFVAGEDFITVENLSSPNLVSAKSRAQKLSDYHLTLDMAKELAMVENNEQGRAARRYFIACERKALESMAASTPSIDYDRISPAQAQDLKELVHAIVDAKVQGFAETWARLHKKFRVNSYLELPVSRFEEARDYLLGKLPESAAPIDVTDAPAMVAARNVALDYFNAYREAVNAGKGWAEMKDPPSDVLHGILAHALMSQRILVGFDYITGRMSSTLVSGDAGVVSFRKDDYCEVARRIPMERIPEMLSELSKRVDCHLGAFRERLQRDSSIKTVNAQ